METSKFVVDLSGNYDKESFKLGLTDLRSVITSLMQDAETGKEEIGNALSFIQQLEDAANQKPPVIFNDLRESLLSAIRKTCPSRIKDHIEWPSYYDSVLNYLAKKDGKGLVLMGGHGTGKTLILDAIASMQTDKVCTIDLGTPPYCRYDVSNETWEHFQNVFDKTCKVVVVKHATSFGASMHLLESIIDDCEQKGIIPFIETHGTLAETLLEKLTPLTHGILFCGYSLRNPCEDKQNLW